MQKFRKSGFSIWSHFPEHWLRTVLSETATQSRLQASYQSSVLTCFKKATAPTRVSGVADEAMKYDNVTLTMNVFIAA